MIKSENMEQKKVSSSNPNSTSNIWQDERFQHLVQDPRFRNIPKQKRKVKIDKRFQHMFTNEQFKVKYTVDKYGRKINNAKTEDLKKFYDLNNSSENDDEENGDSANSNEEDEEHLKEEKAIVQENIDLNENDALLSDGEEVPITLRERLLDPHVDYARGEGRLLTDSSSDDESTADECKDELYFDHVWGELDNDAETTEDSTKRLAVCNMDWDRIRAVDLMMLFSSFIPQGGSIVSIKIYPSEFGKQRMAEEDLKGPPELVGLKKSVKQQTVSAVFEYDNEEEVEELTLEQQDSDAEEGDDYHMEKLRQYQLTRLRYYYAVVECDSVCTADKIYKECDGIEYESSATRVDLRFISDDTTFDDEPRDVCLELPDVISYKPRQFTTTALQQAKVDLTWDETALERRELSDKLTKGQLEDVTDKELRKIIAYSSEEEEVEEENKHDPTAYEEDFNAKHDKSKNCELSRRKSKIIDKYKSLLAEINEKEAKKKSEEKYEMELAWEIENDTSHSTGNNFETCKDKIALTPLEKILKKRSEKNKKRKEERKKNKLLAKGINPETISQDSDDSVPDGIDMNDSYFAEEFCNGNFIDSKVKRKDNKKKKLREKIEKTPLEQKEEEKQAQELELLLYDDNDNKKHFSLEKILKVEQEQFINNSKKHKRRKLLKKSQCVNKIDTNLHEDNFEINVDDDRFKAIFESADFNIDPTHSKFKKTKATEQLIEEQLKRRRNYNKLTITAPTTMVNLNHETTKQRLENKILIKSLKRKLQTNC